MFDSTQDAYILNGYAESAKKTNIYFERYSEIIKGFLTEKSPQEIIEVWNSIKKCSCGCCDLIAVETECMGDYDFSIKCSSCGRSLTRTIYDFDCKGDDGYIWKCIADWNNGLMQEDINKLLSNEYDRKRIKADKFHWKNIYPNNMIQNGVDGIYCILNTKDNDKIYACKWSIVYQRKEIEPMHISSDSDIELYLLFMKRYFNLEEALTLPEPSETSSEEGYEVNNYGSFVRAYATIEEAKEGAIARCGWQGINEDTIIKEQ